MYSLNGRYCLNDALIAVRVPNVLQNYFPLFFYGLLYANRDCCYFHWHYVFLHERYFDCVKCDRVRPAADGGRPFAHVVDADVANYEQCLLG